MKMRKKAVILQSMLEKQLKYRHSFRWVLLVVPMMLLGGCRWFSYLTPEEEYCEETEIEVDNPVHFFDSLRLAEYRRHYDSCEMVLQAEWDSIVKAMADTVGMANFVDAFSDSIIAYASEYMNVPYHYGGNGPKAFDCSGFTRFVFRRFGYELKRSVGGQLEDGWKRIDDTSELRRGDLVFFGGRKNPKRMGHVAIVVDNDLEEHVFTFIHATLKRGVIISASNEQYYRIRYMTACRILPE